MYFDNQEAHSGDTTVDHQIYIYFAGCAVVGGGALSNASSVMSNAHGSPTARGYANEGGRAGGGGGVI